MKASGWMSLVSEMAIYDSTRVIGWLSVLLLGVIILLPYLPPVRSGQNPRAASGFSRLPFPLMSFHYWLPPLFALGCLIHAWIPMASHHMARTNYNGLWLATVALGLIRWNSVSAWRYVSRGEAHPISFAQPISH